MADENTKKDADSSFTVDNERTGMVDMPSVTRLLNRKTLGISKPSAPTQRPQGKAPLPSEAFPPSLPNRANQSEITPIKSAIKPVARRTPSSSPKLLEWEIDGLKAGSDPLGHGIAALFDKGAHTALFLAITAPPPGASLPLFSATAGIRSGNKAAIWQGLKWNPTLVPEVWNALVRQGFAELQPPGTMTNIQSNRNIVRGAFGTERDEYLILLRAGPGAGCRGVIAFFSKKSLSGDLVAVLPLIGAAQAKAA